MCKMLFADGLGNYLPLSPKRYKPLNAYETNALKGEMLFKYSS
jgi:hypothetical protein